MLGRKSAKSLLQSDKMEVTVGKEHFVSVGTLPPFASVLSPDSFVLYTLLFTAVGFAFTSSFLMCHFVTLNVTQTRD